MNTIKPGAASELNDAGVLFLKMPLLHSESLEVHEWNVAASQVGNRAMCIQLTRLFLQGRTQVTSKAISRSCKCLAVSRSGTLHWVGTVPRRKSNTWPAQRGGLTEY